MKERMEPYSEAIEASGTIDAAVAMSLSLRTSNEECPAHDAGTNVHTLGRGPQWSRMNFGMWPCAVTDVRSEV